MTKANQVATKAIWFSILSNAVLGIIKLISGLIGHSFALVADATESLSDVLSSVLVLFGLKYAAKPPDENHPYGHGKAEPLVTFFVVAFLFASSIFIALRSIQNIRTPHELPEQWTIYILIAIILWKEGSYRWVNSKSQETNSTALKADAWHHRSDAITSIAALVGIIIARFLGDGYEAADDWAALVASGFILYNSYLIFRPALGEVMDEHLSDELRDEIHRVALEIQGVRNTEKCLIRKAGMQFHVELHAWVDGEMSVRESHQLAHDLKDHLHDRISELGHITIHIEPAAV